MRTCDARFRFHTKIYVQFEGQGGMRRRCSHRMSNHRLKHNRKRSNSKHKKLQETQSPTTYTIKRLNLWQVPRPAFRFFDLPQEIQDLIYRFYFLDSEYFLEAVCSECAEDGFDMHQCLYKAKISGCVPSLKHELTCRKMARDSRFVRDMVCPKLLTFIEKVEIQGLICQFSYDQKYAWLRQRITAISCRGVTKYAISQDVPWNLLAIECPNLIIINIQVRVRHEYVYWRDHYARHALQEDPDDANRISLNLANLYLTAGTLQERSGKNGHIKVQSSHWWPLSTKAHKNCFTKVSKPLNPWTPTKSAKIMNYEVYPDGLKAVNRVFELANMETAKELLKSEDFIRHYDIH